MVVEAVQPGDPVGLPARCPARRREENQELVRIDGGVLHAVLALHEKMVIDPRMDTHNPTA